jgi:hypothetical protein
LLFLIPEPTSKLGATLYYCLNGGLLFSDFLELTSYYIDSSNEHPGNSGFDLEEKNLPTLTTTNGGYRCTEFETTIRAEVTVDLTNRGIWSIVPLTWYGDMKNSDGFNMVSVSSPISLAVYNDGLSSSATTAFYDDFKDLGGWQTWDANPASGSDYWGLDNWRGELYCAAVGNNSLDGERPNLDALGEHIPEYDDNMYSPLERGIDLSCYQRATLRFLADYYIVSGDYLNLQFCNTTGWHTLLNLTAVSSGDVLFNYSLPKDASEIEFIFESNNDHQVGTGFSMQYLEIIGQLPNDANTGMRAGYSFSDALNIPVGSYTGYLGYQDGTYEFDVSNSDMANRGTVFAVVWPPSYSEFTLDLFGPSPNYTHKAGPSEFLQYFFSSSDNQGKWYLRVHAGCGFGQYFFEIGMGHAGGGCPYVYSWNGTSFAQDNNILPASETGNGTDTKDYYLLQQPLAPLISTRQASLYSLQIREFENNTDYIDQVKLMAVDHSQGTSVAVTQEGEIVTYTNPASPLSCVDNYGNNQLAEVARMDGNVSDPSTYYQGFKDDWLLLDFGRVTAANANLILRDDQKCAEDNCINVQVPDAGGGWRTAEVLSPRDFWSMETVKMTAYVPTDGDFVVRLLWTAPHRLDYVGLDTSAQAQVRVSSAPPIMAIHSTLGDVRARLLYDDENCVELVNGQQITLAFILPNPTQGTIRDFIFCTDGYYYTITP